MFKLLQSAKAKTAAIVGSVFGALSMSPAYAAIDLTGVSVDTSDYLTIATFLITALVAFWGVRKGLALLGR
jgi:hypothetical protein